MTVHQQQILPTVVIEIEETAAPSYVAGVVRQPGGRGDFVELARPSVAVQCFALVREVGTKDVQPSVSVEVGRGDPHAGHGLAILVKGDSTKHRFFTKRAIS